MNPSRRSAGILLHITSLPGPDGIGDLGPAAFAFVDALAQAKQTWWQILPLGPTAAGHSPYNAYSAFAGNPNLLSPAALLADGLVDPKTITRARRAFGPFPLDRVDYVRVSAYKTSLLDFAWYRFSKGGFSKGEGAARELRHSFQQFRADHADWLDDFALFMALTDQNGPSQSWPRDLILRSPSALALARAELADPIDRHRFGQFLFYRQLASLRRHMRAKGVKLIGDLPIFVALESTDVWAHPQLFLLDKQRRPKVVAGTPPDYFAATGQRWGNPLYDWKAMRRQKYAWWIARAKATLAQVDLVRIDHFRGFEAFWQIPADAPTALSGKWVAGPGVEFFNALSRALGGLPFIAEDLGDISPKVLALRDGLGLPGMRVLQFAFADAENRWANPFLPHNYIRNTVAYTGTHDNDTTAGWYAALSLDHKRQVRAYLNGTGNGDGNGEVNRRGAKEIAPADLARSLLRLAWSSVADYAIAPLQDVLGLGSEARMNVPGSTESNWAWRVGPRQLTPPVLRWLAELTQTYGRAAESRS